MALTQQSSLSTDQTAFDRIAYFALRSELLFDAVADVMPIAQAMPGTAVTFTIFNDLAVADTPLTETSDVTAVAMSDSQITVTLTEYGNAVSTTAKLRGTSFLDVDAAAANVVGYNAGISVDSVIRDVLVAGTNVVFGGGGATDPSSRTTVQVEDVIEANDVRKVTSALRGANAVSFGGMYMGYIHPDVSYDLRRETGVASWRDPHVYSDPANIYMGEIGAFEGVRFIETPRGKIFTDASNGSGSAGTIDVYCTLIMGRQALAKAHSIVDGNGPFPRVVRGPVTDTLYRFQPIGWYWLGGYGRFREASLRRIESSSSIGSNT
ncbi:MAG: N4-gp56 family major capsid protein [Gammaproteobacteria bacterium]|nr:N4-gp56 family major capsid protein [Gammaproteobacteria bacterium]